MVGTMAWDGLEPTIFELRGDGGTRLSYTSGPQGRGRLFYAGPHGERAYPGDQIDARDTELGREVTVTLHVGDDAQSVNLTLLIPPVRLGGGRAAPLETLAVVTTMHGSFAGAPTGQDYRYEVLPLTGEAFVPDP